MEVVVLGAFLALGLIMAVAAVAARPAALTERETANPLRKEVRSSPDVFDSLPIGLAMRDPRGRYAFVDRAWERVVGTRGEDVIGRTIYGRASKEGADAVMAQDRKALALGPGKSTELQDFVWGERRYMLSRTVIPDAEGAPLGVLVASLDATERYAMEQTVRNQVKFTDDLVDSLPVALAMRDADGRYLFVNRTWEKLFGGTRDQVVGTRLHDRIPKEQADDVVAADRAALERGPGAIVTRDFPFRGRHLMQTRAMMVDGAGKPLGVLTASVDTTERHAAEQALAAEQRRFELVVRAARLGIVDWDGVKRSAWYSPRFKDILRYPPEADTSGWPDYFDMVHADDRARVEAAFREHILGRTGGGMHELQEPIEYRLRRADGSYVWVEAVGASVRDSHGYATRFIASIEDISERRYQEEALRQAVRLREEVERMSRHDLKTPLSSVIAMARLLRANGQLGADDQELLGAIERAGYRILNMVNLSLDLFRMESGTYEFRPRAVDLGAVAARVAADLEAQADSKGVRVRVRAGGASTAYGEELLCYSMFANLVKNAIEAAPDGSDVTITFEKRGDGSSPSLLVHVHNAGAVPEALRPRFFQKYATAGKSGGIGLGAYSARLMARVQQGEITLHTSEEEGTTLTVRLAAAPHAEQPLEKTIPPRSAARASADPSKARRVLVVDDDEFNRIALRRSLPNPPFEVELAVNGRAALAAARRAWPDVVLLDIEMPVMDGYQTAVKLRGLEREGRKRLIIIAISSNDDDAIVKRALGAGCDHYIVKPAARDGLLQLLNADGSGTDDSPIDGELKASLPAFLASRRRMLDEMPGALREGDRARFRRLAHKLAGGFALYGLEWAAEECRRLERDAADGEVAELAKRALVVRKRLEVQ